jgi:hypothetical protein
VESFDRPTVRDLAQKTAADGYRIQTLILGIVKVRRSSNGAAKRAGK